MSAPMLRTFNKVAHAPQVRTIVSRTLPRAGGGGDHDDHPHLVFDTGGGKHFSKFSAGLVVWGGVALGIGILYTAVSHQQKKHGFWK